MPPPPSLSRSLRTSPTSMPLQRTPSHLPLIRQRMSNASWCLLESDPGIFTEMLQRLGVRGVQIEEVIDLDPAVVEAASPLGLFFLFKWDKNKGRAPASAAGGGDDSDSASTSGSGPPAPPPFFARQTLGNACGTLAMLHVLLNTPAGACPGFELGQSLSDYAAFAADLPPDLRGDLLASCEPIRATHNMFARPEPLGADDDDDDERRARGRKADAFHFVAYVPAAGGRAYELDGLKPAPVPLPAASQQPGASTSSPSAWLRAALAEIQRRIGEYRDGELHFSVLACVPDRLRAAAAELAAAAARLAAAHATIEASFPGALASAPAPSDVAAGLAADVPEFAAAAAATDVAASRAPLPASALSSAAAAAAGYSALLADIDGARRAYRAEADAREASRVENERRRHNFVPFIMALLSGLASKGALLPQLEGGRARLRAARERSRAAGRSDRGE